LLDHGRRRLVFAGDPDTSHDISERYAGFVDALETRGVREAQPPMRVWFEEASAPEIVARLQAGRDTVDALVCANDELALATMALLGREGVSVPDDIAIVGFDDIMASRYVAPGLTTVRQPTHGLGRWAAIRLHERIQGRTHAVQPQILPTRVMVRGSCGCAWDGPTIPAPVRPTPR
jgi:LacI family transcriptional regulator, galactose operon repressor